MVGVFGVICLGLNTIDVSRFFGFRVLGFTWWLAELGVVCLVFILGVVCF